MSRNLKPGERELYELIKLSAEIKEEIGTQIQSENPNMELVRRLVTAQGLIEQAITVLMGDRA